MQNTYIHIQNKYSSIYKPVNKYSFTKNNTCKTDFYNFDKDRCKHADFISISRLCHSVCRILNVSYLHYDLT